MPREIINEIDVSSKPEDVVSQAVLAWGWDLSNGNCAALLNINTRLNGQWQGTSVALGWGDLERLNKSVRRAMKHYQRAAAVPVLPAVTEESDGTVHVHEDSPNCAPDVTSVGLGHKAQFDGVYQISQSGDQPAALIQEVG